MTIKDIARLANVSASTVSKITNGKDAGIRPETIERVLKVIKEYQYRPYDKIRTEQNTRSFLIGILIADDTVNHGFLTCILEKARSQGYSTIVCASKNGEEEYKGLTMMLKHRVDGLIWEPLPDAHPQCAIDLKKSGIPVQTVGYDLAQEADGVSFDYHRLGYLLMEALMKHKHRHVLCLTDKEGGRFAQFRSGCEQCMFDYQVPVDQMIHRAMDVDDSSELIPFAVTGVVCSSARLTARVYAEANRTNRRIPKYLSLVGLKESAEDANAPSDIVMIRLPYEELGRSVCGELIRKIERDPGAQEPFRADYRLSEGESIDVPITCRNKKIVVVGTLNMDTLVNIESFPRTGETTRALRRATMPGGKGINQAVGAAKLGAEVYLIGVMGDDYDASKLFNFLKQHNVNTDGLLSTSKADTGHAYVYVQEDGESSIVIYDGANRCLTCEDIRQRAHLFENASFCLIQTEMELELVTFVAELARRNGCKVILKPSVLSRLSDRLLQSVDILLPNEREINTLCPDLHTFEEKAQHFLDRGVETVVITLGSKGGYYRDAAHSDYFAAAGFAPVDTTGAADVFCAVLAVYLSQNYDMQSAIRYANVAAGYSTTHYGAAPSFLIDKQMLDFLVDGRAPNK